MNRLFPHAGMPIAGHYGVEQKCGSLAASARANAMDPRSQQIAAALSDIALRMRSEQEQWADAILSHAHQLLEPSTPATTPVRDEELRERDALRTRCDLLETHVDALRTQLASANSELDMLRREVERLRDPIVRYAIACAAVDLQQALRRRLPAGDWEETLDSPLRDALRDEQAASEGLRNLARQLQASTTPRTR